MPSSPGTRQRPVTKKAGPSKEAFAGCQVMGHPAKKFKKKLKKFFAGCLTAWHPAKADGRWPPSSRPPLPAAIFCRVAGTRQRPIFADGWNLPSARLPAKADLPEAFLRRVPDKKHPANLFAPGKSAVSCSESEDIHATIRHAGRRSLQRLPSTNCFCRNSYERILHV